MTTDGILQQGAFGEDYPTWFSAYLESITIKKEEVKAAELDKVLQQYEDVSQVFRSNVTTAYRAETRLEAARKAEEESLTEQLLHHPVSYVAPYLISPGSLSMLIRGKFAVEFLMISNPWIFHQSR